MSLMRRRPRIRSSSRAARNTLPGFYFISVMETQHSSLLFGRGDGSCSKGARGAIMKTFSDHSPSKRHLNNKTFRKLSAAGFLQKISGIIQYAIKHGLVRVVSQTLILDQALIPRYQPYLSGTEYHSKMIFAVDDSIPLNILCIFLCIPPHKPGND